LQPEKSLFLQRTFLQRLKIVHLKSI